MCQDPLWDDKISGKHFKALLRALPELQGTMESSARAEREAQLDPLLAKYDLGINHSARTLLENKGARSQHLLNALELSAHLVARNYAGVEGQLIHFWGRAQNESLTHLFSGSPDDGLLVESQRVVAAAEDFLEHASQRATRYESVIAYATLVHHVNLAGGEVDLDFRRFPEGPKRAFVVRSSAIGEILASNSVERVKEYSRLVKTAPGQEPLEAWALPNYSTDGLPSKNFDFPRSIELRETAVELDREIENHNEAYLYYLSTVFLPLTLERSRGVPPFGLKTLTVSSALEQRLHVVQHPEVSKAVEEILSALKHSLTAAGVRRW